MTASDARNAQVRILALEEALEAAVGRIAALEAAANTRTAVAASPIQAASRAGQPRGEPRWLKFVRWAKPCATCGVEIPAGPGLAFYEPATKEMFCERHGDERWVELKAAGANPGAKPRIAVTV